MNLFVFKDSQSFAKLCFFWGVGVPLVLMGSMKIVPWFAAVQYYGLLFLFVGQFLFFFTAIVAHWEKTGAAKFFASMASIPSIASGVLAISLVNKIQPENVSADMIPLVHAALYAFYGLYLLGCAYIVVSAYKVEKVAQEEQAEAS